MISSPGTGIFPGARALTQRRIQLRSSTSERQRAGGAAISQRSEVMNPMPVVHVREEESFENALRRFKRKVEKSGVLTELRKRQHFEKPSVKRKRKAMQAKKKMMRKLADERRQGLA